MKKELKIKILQDSGIPYIVKLSNRKTIRIRFDASAVLIINAPQLIKIASLEAFVEKNIAWIKEKYNNAIEKKVSYDDGSIQYFLGKPYILKINYSKTPRLDLVNGLMMVSISQKEDIRKFILKWRKEQAEVILSEVLYQCYMKFEKELISFPKLEIKYSKRQLGACFYKLNKIMLNSSLTVLPINLIEYVVFHELNHFVHPNHSKEYHQNLRKYVQNEKECLKQIKTYNTVL